MLTGGQYSVLRVATAALLIPGIAFASVPWPARAAAFAALALFCVGLFHRAAAVALAVWVGATVAGAPSESHLLALLSLALHAALPPKPYGTLAMRGDTDPGSGWELPGEALPPLWLALGLTAASWFHPALLGLLLLALSARLRPVAWLAMLAVGAVRVSTHGTLEAPGFFMAALLAFEPRFLPGRNPGVEELIFYDGSCGLCHGFIRFVLSEDRTGAFRFAPLQSETFAQRVPEAVRTSLPDSVVVLTADGRVLSRSAAILHAASRLGGLWFLGAWLGQGVPAGLRDALYDRIAAVRHRLFKKPSDACPMMPKHLRARFSY